MTNSHSGKDSHQFDLWHTVENLRTEFERRVAPRMGRGDVRAAILALLLDEPMHGYQIIHEIEKRTDGSWKPSPGSVYPTLQMLTDEGLLVAKEADGRKTYSLTTTGHEEAAASGAAPWDKPEARESRPSMVLPKAGMKLAEVVSQVTRRGTAEQISEAVIVIDEARRKLYSILAQD